MSYTGRILSDGPLGYWTLSNSSITDFTSNLNYGSVPSTYSVNFLDSVPLTTFATDHSFKGSANITSSSLIQIKDIYSAFYDGSEKSVFGIEFWLSLPNKNSSSQQIINFYSTTYNTNVAAIYAKDDFLNFTVNVGGNTYTVTKQIFSWDYKMHVFAVYKEGIITLYVNGLSDNSVTIPTNQFFTVARDNSSVIKIVGANSGYSYNISDLAFYDRELSLNEIRYHMMLASEDSNPVGYVQHGSAYHIPTNIKPQSILAERYFRKQSDYDSGSFYNLISDNSGLTIRQSSSAQSLVGTWIYNVPTSHLGLFAGVDISWDSGSADDLSADRYAAVFASYDGGSTYNQISNGKVVPNFMNIALNGLMNNLTVKVQIYSSDTSLDFQPRLDNLLVRIYRTLQFPSDSGGFLMTPFSSTTFVPKKDSNSFINRSKNFGFLFTKQSNSTDPGRAEITTTAGSIVQTVDFWFQYNGSGSAVFDHSTGSDIDVYVSNNKLLTRDPSVYKLYVNGQDATSAGYTLVNGNEYFVTIVYGSPVQDNMFLNSASSTAGYYSQYTPSEAVYGYISMFPNQMSLSEVQSRYLSYLTINVSPVIDSLTSLGSILEYSGSSTSLNGGSPVLSFVHV